MSKTAQAAPCPTELLSIVIPTLNEGANIRRVVLELEELVHADPSFSVEVIVADDGSTDGTCETVESLMADRRWLTLIRRSGVPDLSRSVVEGWQSARGTWLGVMDGDLQHPGSTWA